MACLARVGILRGLTLFSSFIASFALPGCDEAVPEAAVPPAQIQPLAVAIIPIDNKTIIGDISPNIGSDLTIDVSTYLTPICRTGLCNDDNLCTIDKCVNGSCSNTRIVCLADTNPCTSEVCDPTTGGCTSINVANGTACDD